MTLETTKENHKITGGEAVFPLRQIQTSFCDKKSGHVIGGYSIMPIVWMPTYVNESKDGSTMTFSLKMI